MKINWKVRFNNPLFVAQILAAFFIPILGYYGLTAQDLTTWGALGAMLFDAISNPYVLLTVAISLYNAVTDPTTGGTRDSSQSMKYLKPKREAKK